jgi:hypothetical protein
MGHSISFSFPCPVLNEIILSPSFTLNIIVGYDGRPGGHGSNPCRDKIFFCTPNHPHRFRGPLKSVFRVTSNLAWGRRVVKAADRETDNHPHLLLSLRIGEIRLLWGGFLKLLLNFGKSRKTFQNTNITLFD